MSSIEMSVDEHCPVKALKGLLVKSQSDCKWFYQRSKKEEYMVAGVMTCDVTTSLLAVQAT